jgi:esterase/lipase
MLQIRSGGPHHHQHVRQSGPALGAGRAVGILLHGRGATAESILELVHSLSGDSLTWLAPQAAGHDSCAPS